MLLLKITCLFLRRPYPEHLGASNTIQYVSNILNKSNKLCYLIMNDKIPIDTYPISISFDMDMISQRCNELESNFIQVANQCIS